MEQYSFLMENGNGVLSRLVKDKNDRRKLARYLKRHMHIRKAADPKNGNEIVRDLGKRFIKNGFKDIKPVNQEELRKALDITNF